MTDIPTTPTAKFREKLRELLGEIVYEPEFWNDLEKSTLAELTSATCTIDIEPRGPEIMIHIGNGDWMQHFAMNKVEISAFPYTDASELNPADTKDAKKVVVQIDKLISRLQKIKTDVEQAIDAATSKAD